MADTRNPSSMLCKLTETVAFCLITLATFSLTRAEAQTTDPVTLLRQVPRVQFPVEPNSVAPEATRAMPRQIPEESKAPEVASLSDDAQQAKSVEVAPPPDAPAPQTATPPRGRSLLSRIPLVGRLIPSSSSESTRKIEESAPSPTPPVLLPPPTENEPADVISAGAQESVSSPTPRANFYTNSTPSSQQPLPPSLSALSRTPLFSRDRIASPALSSVPAAGTRRAPQPDQIPSAEPSGMARESATLAAPPMPRASASQPQAQPSPSLHITYPRLTNADFVAPSPEIETNDAARNEYLLALTAAREGKTVEAAAAFRSFAQRYPTSRLAPRALFMAALLDTDPAALAQDVALLRKFFPRSDYLTELELRGVISSSSAQESPSAVPPSSSMTPTPQQDPRVAVVQLREEAERDYRDKNYPAAIAKLENSPLTAQDPSLLELLAQCQIAMGDNVGAATTIEKILASFPFYERRKNVRLTYGLLLEDAGKYERAVAEYRKLIEEAPESVEAQTARTRIAQIDQLSR